MSNDVLIEYPWLGPLAWQSTLCLAAGLGGSFLLRKSAARAHQVLLLSLVAAVAIPVLRQVVKQNQWGLLVAERAVATPEPRPAPAPVDWAIPDRPTAIEPESVPPATREPERVPVAAKPRLEWTRALLPAWGVVSVILLLRVALQFLLGRRLAKRSDAVEDSLLLQMIERAKGKLGVQTGVEVRRSDRARSPVIWCWSRRPTLLLPAGPCLGNDRLDWVSIICHELAHAKRRDHVSGLFAELLVCILPWQPLLWWARHRLAVLSEEACDDWVIASGRRASGYARTLLGLTAQSQAAFLPGVVTSRRGLAGRIHRILADGCGSPRAGARWSLAAVVLTGSLAVGIGLAQTRPAPSSPAGTPAPTAAREQLDKTLDAMLYHDRAVLPIALHTEADLYDLDAPADSQHTQTYVFEQRLDGKRLDSLMNVYRLRDGQFQHQQVNRRVFDGEQFVYRQQQVGDRSSPDGGVLYPKEEASRILGANYMWGSTLLGYLPGDEEPVASLLKKAAEVVLHKHGEEVEGFACHVIEGKTDHGTYKLWVDPAHDFRIRRAIIDKGPDDLYHGKPVSAKPPLGLPDRIRTSVHTEISGVKLVKIGAHFIPTVESTTTAYKMVSGKEGHSKIVVKRSQIDLNPDFEKLGAFVMDGIPEGASLTSFDPNDHTYAYEWRNGKAVSVAPDGGTLVGRLQFPGHADLSTILTDKRSFHAQFTPAGLGEKDSRNMTLRPERNGTFQVKDIPPGRYRLTLEMSEMKLVPAAEAFETHDKGTGKSGRVILGPSIGGFVWRGSILAEVEREFSIPEDEDAARKTVDLGVIEMVIPSTTEPVTSTDKGEQANTAPGQTQKAGLPAQITAPAEVRTAVNEDKILLRLVDPNGRPVAGARVGVMHHWATPDSGGGSGQVNWFPPMEPSNQDGQVILDTASLFQESQNKTAVYILHEERGMGAIHEIARGAPSQTSPIVLKPLCRVHGTCDSAGLTAVGMPLRSVRVEVGYGSDRQPVLYYGWNLPKRNFDFPLPPGVYTLSFSGPGSKEETASFLRAQAEDKEVSITVPEGRSDLDLGAIDLAPTKWTRLIGQPAPEIGPMKAWKNGSPVTLADLRGQLVWLRFGDGRSLAAVTLRRLALLQEDLGDRGLTVVAISNDASLEELERRRSEIDGQLGGVGEVPFRIAIDGDRATFERYGITGSPTDILIDPAGNVLGQADLRRAQEAIAQLLPPQVEVPATVWRPRFDEVYHLADGEVLKRIAPPFIRERQEYYREIHGRAAPRGFNRNAALIFFWDGGLTLWGEGAAFPRPLDYVLHSVLRLQSYEYEGPRALLDLPLPPGDWIVRDKASPEAKLRALEELVARDLARKIRFEQRSVMQEVVVATGRFQLRPSAQTAGTRADKSVHVYAADAATEPRIGAGTARSLGDFLQTVGNALHMPILDRTESGEPARVSYTLHRSSRLRAIADEQERARQLKVLLDHLTEQTDLRFEVRQEAVPVWFVTDPTGP